MARPSILTVVFWGSMTAAVLMTPVLPSQGASLAVTIAVPLVVVILAIVVTLVLGRAGKGPGVGGPSSVGSLWSPAPKYVYTITVVGAALTWTMFGLYLGAALEVWGAGGTPDRSQRFIIALWLLMGLADVWWLLRARPTPVGPGPGESAPAI